MENAKTAIDAAAAMPATVFVALELSRSAWLVAVHSPVADKVSQHRLDGGDTDGLLALIARKRGQAEEKSERPVRVSCCFEAGLRRVLAGSLAARPRCREPGAGRGERARRPPRQARQDGPA